MVLKNYNKALFVVGLGIVALILSYSSLLFLSVSYAHNITRNEEVLSQILVVNSSLNSEYIFKKENVIAEHKEKMVAVKNVSYLNSTLKGFAFRNK